MWRREYHSDIVGLGTRQRFQAFRETAWASGRSPVSEVSVNRNESIVFLEHLVGTETATER